MCAGFDSTFTSRLINATETLPPHIALLWASAHPPPHLAQQQKHNKNNRASRHEVWVPQRAVLHHPAVRAFISHAGPASVQEA